MILCFCCFKICYLEKLLTKFYEDAKNFTIKQQQLCFNYIEEVTIKTDGKKIKRLSDMKKLFWACEKLTSHDHTFFTNDYQKNYDFTLSKYLR